MPIPNRFNLLGLPNKPKPDYWWSGEDSPVDGIWLPRIGGANWILSSGTQYSQADGCYYFDTNNYAKLSLSNINLGTKFWVEMTYAAKGYAHYNYALDFGSLGVVDDGKCGFGVSAPSNATIANRIGLNIKPYGNGDTTPCLVFTKSFGLNEKIYITACGIEDSSEGKSRSFLICGGQKQVGNEFDTVMWNRFKDNSLTLGNSGISQGLTSDVDIFDLKIYTNRSYK